MWRCQAGGFNVPEQPTKGTSPLYLEIPADLRARLDAFVKRTRRKLKGEVCNAIEQYLDREEGTIRSGHEETKKRGRTKRS
jgi:hypothetical protein